MPQPPIAPYHFNTLCKAKETKSPWLGRPDAFGVAIGGASNSTATSSLYLIIEPEYIALANGWLMVARVWESIELYFPVVCFSVPPYANSISCQLFEVYGVTLTHLPA